MTKVSTRENPIWVTRSAATKRDNPMRINNLTVYEDFVPTNDMLELRLTTPDNSPRDLMPAQAKKTRTRTAAISEKKNSQMPVTTTMIFRHL